MKEVVSFILAKFKKFNIGYWATGIFFILVGLDTAVTGKLPRGGIIYDNNLKIFYGFLCIILGLACFFFGIKRK